LYWIAPGVVVVWQVMDYHGLTLVTVPDCRNSEKISESAAACTHTPAALIEKCLIKQVNLGVLISHLVRVQHS